MSTETIKNHGQWEFAPIGIQFECTHAIYPKGRDDSLCYVTSEERAKLLVQWLSDTQAHAEEVARLMKERDEARGNYAKDVNFLNAANDKIHTERDQLRRRVGKLEKLVGMMTPFVTPDVDRGPARRDWCEMHSLLQQISTKGGDELCQSEKSTVLTAAALSVSSKETKNPDVSNPPPTSEPEAGATPETDAGSFPITVPAREYFSQEQVVHAAFSRRLERQRNAAIKEITVWSRKWGEAEYQRDAALARVKELERVNIEHYSEAGWGSVAKALIHDRDQLRARVEELEKHIERIERAGRV